MQSTSLTVICATVALVMATFALCDPIRCTESKRAEIKQGWKLLSRTSVPIKDHVFTVFLADVAKSEESVANKLKVEYYKEAANSQKSPSEIFFDSVTVIVDMDTDVTKLKAFLQQEVTLNPELARTVYGNAPLIAKSLLSVFTQPCQQGKSLLPVDCEEIATWEPCVSTNAETVKRTASETTVSATSTIKEQGIVGIIIFRQSLFGGDTIAIISARGFRDRNEYSLHVQVDCPTRAGGRGFVYNLGTIQPDETGQVEKTITDSFVSLQGDRPKYIIGQYITIKDADLVPISCSKISLIIA